MMKFSKKTTKCSNLNPFCPKYKQKWNLSKNRLSVLKYQNNGASLKKPGKYQSMIPTKMLNWPTEVLIDGHIISKDHLFVGVKWTKETQPYLSFGYIPDL